jgi:hypothetical protein
MYLAAWLDDVAACHQHGLSIVRAKPDFSFEDDGDLVFIGMHVRRDQGAHIEDVLHHGQRSPGVFAVDPESDTDTGPEHGLLTLVGW